MKLLSANVRLVCQIIMAYKYVSFQICSYFGMDHNISVSDNINHIVPFVNI